MEYEIRTHSAYVAIWRTGQRIAKVPIQATRYGLPRDHAIAMAERIVAGLKEIDIVLGNCTAHHWAGGNVSIGPLKTRDE